MKRWGMGAQASAATAQPSGHDDYTRPLQLLARAIAFTDPVTGEDVELLWVKGSGGDLGTLTEKGLAVLRLDGFRTDTPAKIPLDQRLLHAALPPLVALDDRRLESHLLQFRDFQLHFAGRGVK